MNSLPSQTSPFTAQQRRVLGQVYNLILSWRSEKKKLESTGSEVTKNKTLKVEQPVCSQSGGSDD